MGHVLDWCFEAQLDMAGLWIWALIAGSTIDKAKKIYFEVEIEGK